MARRRNLRPDELELWQAVAKTTRPMHQRINRSSDPLEEPAAPAPAAPAPLHPMEAAKLAPVEPRLLPFALGQRAKPAPRNTVVQPKADPVLMDAKAHGKMLRGKLAPEARIDLHGLTLSEAHPELIAFLLGAHTRGLRLVLVITGKGKQVYEPVPRPIGALRHQVPHWLRLPPLSHVVLQVSEAHLKHGGSGAFYVYLRRR